MMRISSNSQGFTLVEMLVCVAILSLLATLLLPAFYTVRGNARQLVCASNLKQVGLGMSIYLQDYDSYFPQAVDPSDRVSSSWQSAPQFAREIPTLPDIQVVLQPYVKSKVAFACPSDAGFAFSSFSGAELNAFPTSYIRYGTSYYYRTELTATKAKDSTLTWPEQINVLFDGVGFWHGTSTPLMPRFNALFADGHVKNMTQPQMEEAWHCPLSDSS